MGAVVYEFFLGREPEQPNGGKKEKDGGPGRV